MQKNHFLVRIVGAPRAVQVQGGIDSAIALFATQRSQAYHTSNFRSRLNSFASTREILEAEAQHQANMERSGNGNDTFDSDLTRSSERKRPGVFSEPIPEESSTKDKGDASLPAQPPTKTASDSVWSERPRLTNTTTPGPNIPTHSTPALHDTSFVSLLENDGSLLCLIVSFLSGIDTLRLHCVNQSLHRNLLQHDSKLFNTHLNADFPEGETIIKGFQDRKGDGTGPPFKKLYLSFLFRWKPIQESDDVDEDGHPRLGFRHLDLKEEDANSLVFFFRLWHTSRSCAVLDWGLENSRQVLAVKPPTSLDLPPLQSQFELHQLLNELSLTDPNERETVVERLRRSIERIFSAYRLTIHVLDVESCRIMTLFEEWTPTQFRNDAATGNPLFSFEYPNLPGIVGRPHRWSPLYRGPAYRNIEAAFSAASLVTSLATQRLENVALREDAVALQSLTFVLKDSSLVMCTFLRALMKEHCVKLPKVYAVENVLMAPLKQPARIQDNEIINEVFQNAKILDMVFTFLDFDLQQLAGEIRLLSKSFLASCLRQIERKLLDQAGLLSCEPQIFNPSDQVHFDRINLLPYFRGDDRTYLTRESAVEDVLWVARCRCFDAFCQSKDQCPGAQQGFLSLPSIHGTDFRTDIEKARRLLLSVGCFEFITDQEDRPRPAIEASFVHVTDKTIYEVCEIVYINSDRGRDMFVGDGYVHGEVSDSLAQHYGVRGQKTSVWSRRKSMTYRRLLRTIFLLFAEGVPATEPYFPEATIATARLHLQDPDGNFYYRTKMIVRLRTASRKQVVLCLDHKQQSRLSSSLRSISASGREEGIYKPLPEVNPIRFGDPPTRPGQGRFRLLGLPSVIFHLQLRHLEARLEYERQAAPQPPPQPNEGLLEESEDPQQQPPPPPPAARADFGPIEDHEIFHYIVGAASDFASDFARQHAAPQPPPQLDEGLLEESEEPQQQQPPPAAAAGADFGPIEDDEVFHVMVLAL